MIPDAIEITGDWEKEKKSEKEMAQIVLFMIACAGVCFMNVDNGEEYRFLFVMMWCQKTVLILY